ncbi:MAG: hypothetical protein Q9195_004438 [Heterodermia aff. obscurata]
MRPTLQDRIFRREIWEGSRDTSIRGLYGDRAWVDDLDIVAELGGHSGCVNALRQVKLPQSPCGIDDQHLNIHSYQPESSTSQFALTTTVSTGHTQNIFSVKFMPHSEDRTLVTCAGDSEVRVFDIEHSGQSTVPPERSNSALPRRGPRFSNLYNGVRYLNHGDTNTRVYRSHADRVKRIVTESSPHVFLTCSEDGEVRQFDLRQPSSHYPPPRGGRGLFARRGNHDSSNGPPPLISYKRFNLDLNTISCSGSQPHYIALGGAHLHCFLHDRRMLGRDRFAERGTPENFSPANSLSENENELMGQATQCVRKFAPNGRSKMRRRDYNGHITACKISDTNPNEMIASWSGDYIYSFDLVKSPDAGEVVLGDKDQLIKNNKGKYKESSDRKRKRKKTDSTTSAEGLWRSSKPRPAAHSAGSGDLALRVRYENGQSEDIAVSNSAGLPRVNKEEARESLLNDIQRRSMQIAKSMVKMRQFLFSLDASTRESRTSSFKLSAHTPSFTAALGLAASCLPEMDEIIRSWGYPMNPDEEDIVLQQTLRANRDSSRRFVQAAGTVARFLGGKLQTVSPGSTPALQMFEGISSAPQEGPYRSSREIFSYDFLKAIILWLRGGQQALLQGFKRSPSQRNNDPRFPIPAEAELSGVDDYLIPYLLGIARQSPIPNVDASTFEVDERRRTFQSESAAVIAFSNAIRMPLEDLSRAIMPSVPSGAAAEPRNLPTAQDRSTAFTFWGFKVCRGLLLNAGESVNFRFVDLAFGGLGMDGPDEGRVQEDIDPNEIDGIVDTVTLVGRASAEQNEESAQTNLGENGVSQDSADRSANENGDVEMGGAPSSSRQPPAIEVEEADSGSEVILMEDLQNDINDHLVAYDDEQTNEDGEDEDEDEDNDSDEDGDITAEERHFMFQSASDRGKRRESVEADVPYSTHSRQYRGHCNVRTVKDCNFYGLQDEYVVSGSDSGHLFIWDKKTTELVNILEGDEEVVNVAQGHPYEPLLAVSGIDHTIKIFSPDARAQDEARRGVNNTIPRSSTGYSSLSSRRRRSDAPAPSEGLESRKRMHDSYQITSQNDAERQGGMREAFISRGMLAQLAARLRARTGTAGEGEEVDEDGGPVVLDDNCIVSPRLE